MKKNPNYYSLIVIAAFLLGIILLPTKKREFKSEIPVETPVVRRRPNLEHIRELERQRMKLRRAKQLRTLRSRKAYEGPFEFAPYSEHEDSCMTVSRSLFGIATILEHYWNDPTPGKLDEHKRFLMQYYEQHQESALREILLMINNLERIPVIYKTYFERSKRLLYIKIFEYLYNIGCRQYGNWFVRYFPR